MTDHPDEQQQPAPSVDQPDGQPRPEADASTTAETPVEEVVAARPQTGDRTVDDALAGFDRSVAEGPGGHVSAAADAHRALQARLTSPPAEPPGPGQARPGPPR